MPLVGSLMGLGLPGPLAGGLGNTPQSITAAATTTASGATTVQPGYHIVLITCATTTANSVVISTAAGVGTPLYVVNLLASTGTASIYTPNVTGATMNGTTNGSVLLTTAKTCMLIQSTANQWVSFPLSP